MYTVYHLPQLEKVGCTNNFERRMKEQDVEPLDEYRKFVGTLEEASFVEEELRKFYKYKPDSNMTYLGKFSGKKTKKNGKSITKEWTKTHSIGWNELPFKSPKSDLEASMNKYNNITFKTKVGTFEFDSSDIPSLVRKAKQSQFDTGDWYWQTTTLKAIENESNQETVENGPCAHGNRIPEFDQIREWASEKGIYAKGDPKTQLVKLVEEQGEFAKAILNDDQPEIIDALGDMLVVLINLSELSGYKLEECLESAYNVIKKRTGKMIDGTFVKDTL